jgi:hypothetical protein
MTQGGMVGGMLTLSPRCGGSAPSGEVGRMTTPHQPPPAIATQLPGPTLMIHNHITERQAASGWAMSGVVLVVIDVV